MSRGTRTVIRFRMAQLLQPLSQLGHLHAPRTSLATCAKAIASRSGSVIVRAQLLPGRRSSNSVPASGHWVP